MTRTNEQLMMAYQNGDQEALAELYENMYEPLYCFLIRYTSEVDLSIDTVHDVFETVQKKKEVYEAQIGTVKAFLFQIAYRLLINKLQRRKRWRKLLPSLVPKETKSLAAEDRLTIQTAISELSENHRAVILLAYYEDATQDEISQILHIPIGTVKSRLYHAIKQLKQQLKVDFQDER